MNRRNFLFILGLVTNFTVLYCNSQGYCYINAGEWCSNIVKKSQRYRFCTCANDLVCIDNKCQEKPLNFSTSIYSVIRNNRLTFSDSVAEGGSGVAPFECLLPLGAVCDKGLGKELSVYCKCLKGMKCKNYVCVADDNAKAVGAKKHSQVTNNASTSFNPDIRRKDCRLLPGSPCRMPRRSLKEICLCQPGHRCLNNVCTSYNHLNG